MSNITLDKLSKFKILIQLAPSVSSIKKKPKKPPTQNKQIQTHTNNYNSTVYLLLRKVRNNLLIL